MQVTPPAGQGATASRVSPGVLAKRCGGRCSRGRQSIGDPA